MVIAIIAILAAMLLPVLARAREQARMTTCLANLKQIGLAVQMYLGDYNEYWYPTTPGYGTAYNNHSGWQSSGFLRTLVTTNILDAAYDPTGSIAKGTGKGYLPGTMWWGYPVWVPGGSGIDGDWHLKESSGTVHCPDMATDMRDYYAGYYGYFGDYTYNTNLPTSAVKLGRVKKPAETALFWEGNYGQQSPTAAIFDNTLNGCGLGGQRHQTIKLVNTVFVDGHAKALTKEDFVLTGLPQ